MSTLVIGFQSVPGFPVGSTVDHLHVQVFGTNPSNSQSQSVSSTTATVSFTLVPDTYTFSIQAVDPNGNALGTPVTKDVNGNASFTVPTVTTVSLSLPASVTVTP